MGLFTGNKIFDPAVWWPRQTLKPADQVDPLKPSCLKKRWPVGVAGCKEEAADPEIPRRFYTAGRTSRPSGGCVWWRGDARDRANRRAGRHTTRLLDCPADPSHESGHCFAWIVGFLEKRAGPAGKKRDRCGDRTSVTGTLNFVPSLCNVRLCSILVHRQKEKKIFQRYLQTGLCNAAMRVI
jgi:hypothetical protein